MSGRETSASTREIVYLTDFRGVAIVMIMALHTVRTLVIRGSHLDDTDTTAVFILSDALFHNATLYFTLISAFIYAQRLHRRSWPEFMAQRLRNVFVPYAFVSILLTMGTALRSGNMTSGLIGETLYNIAMGEAFYHLWYIPVIIILYAVSPVLLAIARKQEFAWLAWFLILMPLVFPRQGTEVTFFTIAYFLGAYMVGLRLGLDLEAGLDSLGRYTSLLWVVTLSSTAGIVYLLLTGAGKVGWLDASEALFYVQRMASAGLILLFLRGRVPKPRDRLGEVLRVFAKYAFAFYFLHAPVIRAFVALRNRAFDVGLHTGLVFDIIAIFALTSFTCWVAVRVLKRVFGRSSALMVGA